MTLAPLHQVRRLLPLLALAASCGGDLRAELEAARPGDTVRASGLHQGPIQVPAGVALVGDGLVIEATGSGAAVEIETGAGLVTRLEGARITSGVDVALAVRGSGAFHGRALEVACSRGIGVAAEGLADLQLDDTAVRGSITHAVMADLSYPLSTAQVPVLGLVVSGVASARLTRVKISGFAGFGAALVGSTVTWSGEGGTAQGAGVGIIADGGKLTLEEGVAVRETWAGQRGLAIFSYGLVLTGGVEAQTRGLRVEDGDGYGVLQENARAAHSGLAVKGNADVGVWLQRTPGVGASPALRIEGASSIKGNRGGGLFVLESGGVELEGVTVSGTQSKPVMVGTSGSIEMGDGVQLSGLTAAVSLKKVNLVDNARVGALLSGKPPSGGVVMAEVTISGIGKYGLIPENDYPIDGSWQVARDAALEQADKSISAKLGAARPMSALPGVAPLKAQGLLGASGLVHVGVQIGKDGLLPR